MMETDKAQWPGSETGSPRGVVQTHRPRTGTAGDILSWLIKGMEAVCQAL